MKPAFLITAILAAAVTIGLWQNSRLHELKRQSASIEFRATHSAPVRPARPLESVPPTQSASQAEQDALFEEAVSAFLAFKHHKRSAAPDQVERRHNMLLTAAKFNAEDIERFLQKLREDPRLAGKLNENETIQFCLEIFSSTTPVASMKFLEGHRELTDWSAQYADCFRRFLDANSRDAIRWFDEQTALGNPDIANSRVRQSILIHEARIDPDKMLARAITPDFASDPETLSHLGGIVASTLKHPSEHQRFLAALSRKQNESDPSPQLLKIRAEYIDGLSETLAGFRFEDASVLVDSEFTLDEKLNFLSSISHRGDLADPAKWEDWLLKIDSSAWDNWVAAKGTKYRNPATEVFSNWAGQDSQAAGRWLENLSDSPLKTEMTLEYAWKIADIDPVRAASYLPQLSEAKGKTNLAKKIAAALDSKDPAAAAAFRGENPASK